MASISVPKPNLPRPQRAPRGIETLPQLGYDRAETLRKRVPTHEETPAEVGVSYRSLPRAETCSPDQI